MEVEYVKLDRARIEKAKTNVNLDRYAKLLYQGTFERKGFEDLWSSAMFYGHRSDITQVTADDFLNPNFKKGLYILCNHDFADLLMQAIRDVVGRQYGIGSYRRSFRCYRFADFDSRINLMIQLALQHYYRENALYGINHNDLNYFVELPEILSCKINNNETETINGIIDAMEGDNNVKLDVGMIRAVILSKNEMLKDKLLLLLKAAKLQEGLRQSILENCDMGDYATFVKFANFCREEDMFRFSSTVRACFTWCGLDHEKTDYKAYKNLCDNIVNCLNDDAYFDSCFISENPVEVYLHLWRLGNEDIDQAVQKTLCLIDNDNRMRKLVGWYFLCQIGNQRLKNETAVSHLDVEDAEMMAYVQRCLFTPGYTIINNRSTMPNEVNSYRAWMPKGKTELRKRFDQILSILSRCKSKTQVFSPSLFPFYSITYDPFKENLLLLFLLQELNDDDSKDAYENAMDCFDAYYRGIYYKSVLNPIYPKEQLRLYKGLQDKSPDNRIEVLKKLKTVTNLKFDSSKVAPLFSSKSEKIRRAALELVEAQNNQVKQEMLDILVNGDESQKQIAMELLKDNPTLKSQNIESAEKLINEKLSAQSEILQKQVMNAKPMLSKENGYGIYDPHKVEQCYQKLENDPQLAIVRPKTLLNSRSILLDATQMNNWMPDGNTLFKMTQAINRVVEKHKDYQYQSRMYDGRVYDVIFGQDKHNFIVEFKADEEFSDEEFKNFKRVPFYEEIADELLKIESEPYKIVLLYYLSRQLFFVDRYSRALPNGKKFQLQVDFADRFAKNNLDESFRRCYNKLAFALHYLYDQVNPNIIFETMMKLYFSLINQAGYPFLTGTLHDNVAPTVYMPDLGESLYMFEIAKELLSECKKTDEQFELYFKAMLQHDHKSAFMNLNYKAYTRAIKQNIIEKDVFFSVLLSDKRNTIRRLRFLTDRKMNANEKDKELMKSLAQEISTGIIAYESLRGQKDTELSEKAAVIEYVEGVDNLCRLIKCLGDDKLNRYSEYVYGTLTKSELLSILLRHCWPKKTDTAKMLIDGLKDAKIPQKRLVEIAVYAPQWASMIGELIEFKDLKKAVWFFQAHISEAFSAAKETEVANYSQISPVQFNDGAFDIAWYREIESELTEKQMKMLYDSAKYITNGSNAHRRSQLYVDAISGKLDEAETENEIKDKRNQDKLRAYALIPLKDDKNMNLLHRYDVICDFGKGSKAFGAQKRASENKAVLTALDNLAINCGLFDVNRMIWHLEGLKNDLIKSQYEGLIIGSYLVRVAVDDDGNVSLQIEKDGKALKTVPKELAKDETVLELKETVKELKDQKTRNRMSLENAMINQLSFAEDELKLIIDSPVLYAMISRLVWVNETDEFVLIKKENGALVLTDINGRIIPLANRIWRIAHPDDFFKAKIWSTMMSYIVEHQIIQPFKQVFREYYPTSPQEQEEQTVSRRYAGIQVQKNKMMGLLKNRGWVVNYEEGFNKIFYRQNLTAHLYCYADWFTPSDIEEPTIEEIEFNLRNEKKIAKLTDINPIIFSETMRDLDLVVSCAYVGDVDIQTSQSTIEMRQAVAIQLCKLMKLNNVTFEKNFAIIEGKLSRYSIHLGSGTVNTFEKGILPVFPVFSQHRGHIFLPFADEDPKTAQILSEIITFAQDDKIKDPSILQWLK